MSYAIYGRITVNGNRHFPIGFIYPGIRARSDFYMPHQHRVEHILGPITNLVVSEFTPLGVNYPDEESVKSDLQGLVETIHTAMSTSLPATTIEDITSFSPSIDDKNELRARSLLSTLIKHSRMLEFTGMEKLTITYLNVNLRVVRLVDSVPTGARSSEEYINTDENPNLPFHNIGNYILNGDYRKNAYIPGGFYHITTESAFRSNLDAEGIADTKTVKDLHVGIPDDVHSKLISMIESSNRGAFNDNRERFIKLFTETFCRNIGAETTNG